MKISTAADLARWIAFVGALKLPLEVSAKPWRKTRTNQQNNYLFGVCYAALRDATGQDIEDWHEYMLGEWAGWEEYELFGRKRLRPRRRSSKLSTIEFADYVAFIHQRASENGIFIQDPMGVAV